MAKLKLTLIYALLIFVIAAISSLLIVMYMTAYSDESQKVFWIVWISSLLPTIVLSSISAFLYHYLCESKKKLVHALWFIINLGFIVGFAPFISFVVLSSMLN